jgi:predicted nucleotidyltransferase
MSGIHDERVRYSRKRLEKLRSEFKDLPELDEFPALTIFGAGSYARLEASQYSDIDMFFLSAGDKKDVPELRTNSLRLFGKVIEIVDKMRFPKFSNDCEYLVILHSNDILSNLGSRTDDHENYFTARLLLLLESHCLYGQEVFDDITAKIIKSYFKDYPDHKKTFQPMFLLNDICRFWKTLLLNYENKRNLPPGAEGEERRTRQKVRNFKLKYSRMTTCFASIAALGSYGAPVTEKQVLEMTKLTPRQRLESIISRVPKVTGAVGEVLDSYGWFLEMTGLPTAELEEHFSDKQKRTEMFQKANEYGDSMFRLLQTIDETNENLRLVRNLVI